MSRLLGWTRPHRQLPIAHGTAAYAALNTLTLKPSVVHSGLRFRCASAPRLRVCCCRWSFHPVGAEPSAPPQRQRHRFLDIAVALHALPKRAASCARPTAWTPPVLPLLPDADVVGGRPRVANRMLGFALDPRLLACRGHLLWGPSPRLHHTRLLALARPQHPNSSPRCLGSHSGAREPADAPPPVASDTLAPQPPLLPLAASSQHEFHRIYPAPAGCCRRALRWHTACICSPGPSCLHPSSRTPQLFVAAPLPVAPPFQGVGRLAASISDLTCRTRPRNFRSAGWALLCCPTARGAAHHAAGCPGRLNALNAWLTASDVCLLHRPWCRSSACGTDRSPPTTGEAPPAPGGASTKVKAASRATRWPRPCMPLAKTMPL